MGREARGLLQGLRVRVAHGSPPRKGRAGPSLPGEQRGALPLMALSRAVPLLLKTFTRNITGRCFKKTNTKQDYAGRRVLLAFIYGEKRSILIESDCTTGNEVFPNQKKIDESTTWEPWSPVCSQRPPAP